VGIRPLRNGDGERNDRDGHVTQPQPENKQLISNILFSLPNFFPVFYTISHAHRSQHIASLSTNWQSSNAKSTNHEILTARKETLYRIE
jgi:hypothetical protein